MCCRARKQRNKCGEVCTFSTLRTGHSGREISNQDRDVSSDQLEILCIAANLLSKEINKKNARNHNRASGFSFNLSQSCRNILT